MEELKILIFYGSDYREMGAALRISEKQVTTKKL